MENTNDASEISDVPEINHSPEVNDSLEIKNNDATETEMVHQQDLDNQGTSAAPLEKFTIFNKLPPELRRMIVEEATLPSVIDILSNYKTDKLRPDTLAIGQVNYEMREPLKKTTVTFKSITLTDWPLVTIRMNPVRDTYLTHDLKFPWAINPTDNLPTIDFRKIVSTFTMPDLENAAPFDLATTDEAPIRGMDLRPFPDVKEYIMLPEILGFEFWIPDVEVPYERGQDALDDDRYGYDVWKFVPRIANIGYHVGPTAIGGNWAGFRYHTSTGMVEFTPLAYWEVSEYLAMGLEHRDYFPDAAIRIWIIRPGQEDTSPDRYYHNWERVEDYSELETIKANRIRRLWQLVSSRFDNTRTFMRDRPVTF
ncbi:hypothetical protein B0T10DRAFT_562437 [Thelonectria olida]|uniref:2EXR domain-containing protein n=1 Tax=Thelonectria olida TaxID=1576542 RepID=A0A9P9APE5_9HYPO|nr:hypothetical protein B0T10DRAFT_562437 [Thelonectria olida]